MTRLQHRDAVVRAAALLLAAAPAALFALSAVSDHVQRHAGEPQAVVPGLLYRSRQPQQPIADRLRRHGIGIVVNLRTYGRGGDLLAEERAACDSAGAQFVWMPINTVVPTDEQTQEFLRIVRTARWPVLVHCEHGRTRAGMMVAAYRIVAQGWTKDAARREMTDCGWNPRADHHAEHERFLDRLVANRRGLLEATAPDTTRPGDRAVTAGGPR